MYLPENPGRKHINVQLVNCSANSLKYNNTHIITESITQLKHATNTSISITSKQLNQKVFYFKLDLYFIHINIQNIIKTD